MLTEQKGSVVARPEVVLATGEKRWTTVHIAALSRSYNEANAHLITAAPELYEAGANLLAFIDANAPFLEDHPLTEEMRSVLAKARGEAA
jgi:hypothetical protein